VRASRPDRRSGWRYPGLFPDEFGYGSLMRLRKVRPSVASAAISSDRLPPSITTDDELRRLIRETDAVIATQEGD
jgi:hypothetical protein